MNYNWDKMTDTQKIQAIDKELSLETHMGVTKDDLINMIRYMRGQFEVEAVTLGLNDSPYRRIDDVDGVSDFESVLVVGFKFPAVGVKFPDGISVISCEHGHEFVLASDCGYTEWTHIPEIPKCSDEQMQFEVSEMPPKEKVRRIGPMVAVREVKNFLHANCLCRESLPSVMFEWLHSLEEGK